MIKKYDQVGNIIDYIDFPILRPTSCVLGGKDKNILFVTNATESLDRNQLINYPSSGPVLSINLNL